MKTIDLERPGLIEDDNLDIFEKIVNQLAIENKYIMIKCQIIFDSVQSDTDFSDRETIILLIVKLLFLIRNINIYKMTILVNVLFFIDIILRGIYFQKNLVHIHMILLRSNFILSYLKILKF